MFPFVTYGKTDAATTRSPSTPGTRIETGSTTDPSATPVRQVLGGCKAVAASARHQSVFPSSAGTGGAGDISPALNGASAGRSTVTRVRRADSTHSRRAWSVER